MQLKHLRWRRGVPRRAGMYLVFDRHKAAIRLAVVTGLDPIAFRAGAIRSCNTWPYNAYLGPLARRARA